MWKTHTVQPNPTITDGGWYEGAGKGVGSRSLHRHWLLRLYGCCCSHVQSEFLLVVGCCGFFVGVIVSHISVRGAMIDIGGGTHMY